MWRRWSTPQNFFLTFIDELENQTIIKKNCWSGPGKHKIIFIFTMFNFFKKNERKTPADHYQNLDMIYSYWDIEENILKLVILSSFLPFYPPKKLKNLNFEKLKNLLEISSFYTYVPKITIIWCTVPEIRTEIDRIFCHFGPFFALLSPTPLP